MAKVITLFLILAAAPLYAYDKVPVEFDWEQIKADGELIAAYEEKNKLELEWFDEATPAQYVAFWTIQVLDVYSTYRSLKYSCVREANPLLGDVPSVPRMVTHKTLLLHPFYLFPEEGIISKREMNWVNGLGTVVVYNNYKVWDRAHQTCPRR